VIFFLECVQNQIRGALCSVVTIWKSKQVLLLNATEIIALAWERRFINPGVLDFAGENSSRFPIGLRWG